MSKIEYRVEKELRVDHMRYLLLIFFAGCIIGWIYEEIFYWITEGLLRNRGILYGPWLPIYGIGALGIYSMKPLKKHPVLLFFYAPESPGLWSTSLVLSGYIFLGCVYGTIGDYF